MKHLLQLKLKELALIFSFSKGHKKIERKKGI